MDLISGAEQYIFLLFKDKLSSEYIYHDYAHTLRVVSALNELISGMNLPNDIANELLLAGWFHDAGYISGAEGHEQRGCDIFEEFLKNYPQHTINPDNVKRYILATRLEYEPQDLGEMCIKDADFYHLSMENYDDYCTLLKMELEKLSGTLIENSCWCDNNLALMQRKHRYYTSYAITHWQPRKEATILKSRLTERKSSEKKISKRELNEKKYEKLERPERGIDTLFRVTLNNHTQLSAIADSKANILLSVSTIIISIALTAIIPKLDSPKNSHLIIPTFILLIFSVIVIVITIMSTRPKVSTYNFSMEDVKNKKVNLLFFGNFHKMQLEDYSDAMNDLMKERDYLYDTLIKDLYFLGIVLDRKYKLLRTAYTVFMIGIIISVSAFIIAFIRL